MAHEAIDRCRNVKSLISNHLLLWHLLTPVQSEHIKLLCLQGHVGAQILVFYFLPVIRVSIETAFQVPRVRYLLMFCF